VLLGIAVLWLSQKLAVMIGLIVTSWALQGITLVALLLVLIVFSNEISAVLRAHNIRSLLWSFPRKASTSPLEIITDSIWELAELRYGALFVFPGKDDIYDVVHSGHAWQGLISKEMIKSIFWPGNPVHDGAVILKDDRVAEVGAILPLSERRDLPAAFGTRHRAALGLAEKKDALAVAVSEERGEVFAARRGRFETVSNKSAFAAILGKHLGMGPQDEDRRPHGRLQTAGAAIAAVLLVVGVWLFFARGLTSTLITLEVPVKYLNRAPEMEISNISADKVRLHLSGSDLLMQSLAPDQVRVKLNLADAEAGLNHIVLNSQNIDLPPGINLTKIEPASIDLTISTIIKRLLPVQVDWSGKLAEDLILVSVRVTPSIIEFEGRNDIIKNISTVYTQKIPLSRIIASQNITIPLALEDTALKPVSIEKGLVAVSYIVQSRRP